VKHVTIEELSEHWEGVKVSMLHYAHLRGCVESTVGALYCNQVSGQITIKEKPQCQAIL
jgi:hypothetical protein